MKRHSLQKPMTNGGVKTRMGHWEGGMYSPKNLSYALTCPPPAPKGDLWFQKLLWTIANRNQKAVLN